MADAFFFPARSVENIPCSEREEERYEVYCKEAVCKNGDQIVLHGEKYFHSILNREEIKDLPDRFAASDTEKGVVSYVAENSGRKPHRFKMPKLMGVVNCTPDSFYPGSRYDPAKPSSIRSILEMGADILDFGGESTRPNAEATHYEEEVNRLLPVISAVANETKIPISIDTRHPETLRRMLDFGIAMANDISGLERRSMREIVRDNNLEAVLMHSVGTPETMQSLARYDDLIAEVVEYFFDRLALCLQDGIKTEKIILDPGIGFAKTYKDNLSILRNIRCFDLGFRTMVGTSRKSFIGHITGKNVADRLPGTIATSIYLSHNGTDILRIHDVNENRDALDVVSSIDNFGSKTL